MRISLAAAILLTCAGIAHPALADAPSTDANRNEARWANWEAEARMADGDYEGAVEAEKQANTDLHEAERQEAKTR